MGEISESTAYLTYMQRTSCKIKSATVSQHFMADRETIETVADFIFLGSKINANNNCSHDIKRSLLLGRKAMKTLESLLKSRDIIFPERSV